MILSKNDLISELHFSMRKVILAWKTAHFLSFTYFLFMKKVERQGKKVGYEYVPGGSKSKCVSAVADKSVWPGSRKFRNAFQNGTNSFLKVCTFLFSWTIFEDTFLCSWTSTHWKVWFISASLLSVEFCNFFCRFFEKLFNFGWK